MIERNLAVVAEDGDEEVEEVSHAGACSDPAYREGPPAVRRLESVDLEIHRSPIVAEGHRAAG